MKKITCYLSLFIIFSCANESEITLKKFEGSPKFQEAKLSLNSFDLNENSAYDFSFNVENYQLGDQTDGAGVNVLANSAQGQHIHMIVNNGPYSAHYESEFSKQINEGKNLILFFLSRSFHESVKNPNAFTLIQTGGVDNDQPYDISSEFLFYSRPKGVYKGADTKKLLLDFYLVNTEISPQGNKVRATVNGKEFIIDEWVPYYIEGLQIGEVTVKLELINSNGELIDAPFNPVERKVTLE